MKNIILKQSEVHNGALILVNQEHPLRHVNNNELQLVPLEGDPTDILLDVKAATLLSQLIKSIQGEKSIVPVSGYRSHAEQEKIYRDSLVENGKEFTKQYVAKPDQSEHQTGLAIDLGKTSDAIDFIRPDFPYHGICGTFRLKAAQYGFIERYGKGKEAITGISHEPWHFRYVGYPHSQIIQDNQFSLEEYVEFIKEYSAEGDHYDIKQGNKHIEVFYVNSKLDKTTIPLPEGCLYQISGNNVDGFIVTLWRREA